MSKGWCHVGQFDFEPQVLIFKRPIGTNPQNGEWPVGFEKLY